MTNITIKYANGLSVEELQELSLEELKAVATVLEKSKAKKSKLQLDLVKAQIRKGGKAPEQEELPLEEEEQDNEEEILEEEAVEEEEEEEEKEAPKKPKKKVAPKKKKAPKKDQEQEEEDPSEAGRALKFPGQIEITGGKKVVRLDNLEDEEIQRYLIERPYQLLMLLDELVDDDLTLTRVLYYNDEKVVLYDLSRDISTIIVLERKLITKHTLELNNVRAPYKFYIDAEQLIK